MIFAQKIVKVDIHYNSYIPLEIEIEAGTVVQWTNKDPDVHYVTSGIPGEEGNGVIFDKGLVENGIFEFLFQEAGTFPYFDRVNNFMTGSIKVVDVKQSPEIKNDFLIYNNSKTGLSIQYPSNWEKEEPKKGKFNLLFISPQENNTDSFREIMGIRIIDLNTQNISLDLLTKEHIDMLESSNDVKIIEDTLISIAKNPAHKIIYTNNQNYKVLELWTVKDHKVYFIQFVAQSAKFSIYASKVQTMVDSFHVNHNLGVVEQFNDNNHRPISYNMILTPDLKGPVGFTLNGSDPDTNDFLSFSIVAKPVKGNITSFDPSSGGGVYNPGPSITDTILPKQDSFVFRVIDSQKAASAPATVTIKFIR